MHIIGDGPTDGDEPCSRRHRQKPAARNKNVENFGEQDACFTAQYATCFVKGDEAIHTARVQQGRAAVQTDIAITASIAVGQQAAVKLRQRRRPLRPPAFVGRRDRLVIAPMNAMSCQRGLARKIAPSPTANHNVASRQISVAVTAVGSGKPFITRRPIITASLLPRPPGRKESPPTSMAKA